jgi:hypothetical protein
MAHIVNRNAFLAVRSCGEPLLIAYGLLVATELALKDNSGAWGKRHDIPQMLDELRDPGLTALGAQLRAGLSSIPCTDVSGNSSVVRSKAYPDLRYARCISDHAGGATNPHIENIIRTVDDIIIQLRGKGIGV